MHCTLNIGRPEVVPEFIFIAISSFLLEIFLISSDCFASKFETKIL